MSQAEQQVAVGRPRANSMDGAERPVCGIGRHIGQRLAIEHTAGDGPGDLLQRADFRPRQAEPGKPVSSRLYQALWGERIIGGGEPPPDRTGARSRKLLGDHYAGYSGKSSRSAPQRQGSGDGRHLGKPGIGCDQRAKACGNIGFGVDAVVHVAAASGWMQESGKIAIG